MIFDAGICFPVTAIALLSPDNQNGMPHLVAWCPENPKDPMRWVDGLLSFDYAMHNNLSYEENLGQVHSIGQCQLWQPGVFF